MAIPISSIGIKVSYAFEAVAGTRPTTGYTHIEGIKEIPELNPAPDTLETTSFDNLKYIPTLYVSLPIIITSFFSGSKTISIHLYYTIFSLVLLGFHCNIWLEIVL